LGALRERELVFQREQSAFAGAREYTFKHTILRDVTYETVLLGLRRRFHAQVASWLEAHAGERLGEYLGLIAGHYELAGEPVKAAEYLSRSGEEASRTSAYRDARAAYERALELLPPEAEAERARLAVALGQALLQLGDLAGAQARSQEGLALARGAAERRETETAALNGLGHVAWRVGDWEEARRCLQDALVLAQEYGDVAGQALAAQHLARVSWQCGEYEEAERWAQESQGWCEQAGDRQGLIAARNELGIVASFRGEYERAKALYIANLAEAQDMGDRFREAQAHCNLGEVAREEGAYEAAAKAYERFRLTSEEIDFRPGVALAQGNLAMVCLVQGRDDAAWQYFRRALGEFVAMQDTPHLLANLAYVSWLRLRGGQPEAAARLLGLALRHPVSSSEVAHEAQPVLDLLREALGAEELEAAMARGAEMNLEQVVAQILAEG
jgi:tetratricopeptide (TPR) repeat protein